MVFFLLLLCGFVAAGLVVGLIPFALILNRFGIVAACSYLLAAGLLIIGLCWWVA
ncbi:MAG: hypothetical protein ACOH2M_08800 [Cypionkella sp.]